MNKFYRRATAFFLLVLYVCAFTLSAFAVIADGQTVKKELVLTYESGGIAVHSIQGTNEALYCIDSSAMSDYNFTLPGGSVTATPSAYWNSLPAATQQALRLVLYYAPKTYTASTKYQCAAAQAIVWEYVNGLRALNNYQTYPISYSGIITANDTAYSAYRSLIQKIERHMKVPTINGDTVTLTGIGEASAVYTNYDSNSVLASDWEVVAPGNNVRVEIAQSNGTLQNRLKVWLTGDIGDQTVTVTLRHKSLTDVMGNTVDPRASTARWIANYPYGGNASAGQPLIGGTLPDPMTATVKVKANLNASLEIVKESTDGKVSGIRFRIEKYEGGGIGWWEYATRTTDANGKILDDSMEIGERLRITEIVPDGYICDSTNPQEITLKAGTNRVSFRNHPTSNLEIVKESTDGKVSGIQFRIEKYEDGGIGWWEYKTLTTDRNGKIQIEDLDVGDKIRVTEIVPEGYVCDSQNPQELTIKAGTNRVTFENHPLCSLEIIKTSTDGKVSGIQFKVEKYEPNGVGWWVYKTLTTDRNGKILIEDLNVGERLRVTEIVPEGYQCESDNPQEITIKAGTNTLSFENKPLTTLEIIKSSEDGSIEGITFTLEVLRGQAYVVIGEYTTDSSGKITIKDLTPGEKYRVSESVPEGYVSKIPTQIVDAVPGTCKVEFENRKIRGTLRIIKQDKATETPLQGAVFEVYDKTGLKVAEGTTDEDGVVVFEDLPYGTYTYRESTAPEGFELDDTAYDFSILEDGKEIVYTADNQPKEGSLTICKTDEEGKPLSGVTFLLEYSTDGETWAAIQHRDTESDVAAGYCTSDGLDEGKLITDEDGIAAYTGLYIDTQIGEVQYRITEIATKNGYMLLPGYAFKGTLSEKEEIDVSFTVVNQPEFKMPATGGTGYTALIAIAAAILTAAGAVWLIHRKAD